MKWCNGSTLVKTRGKVRILDASSYIFVWKEGKILTQFIIMLAGIITLIFFRALWDASEKTDAAGYLIIKNDEETGERYLFLEIDKDKENLVFNHDIVKFIVVKK